MAQRAEVITSPNKMTKPALIDALAKERAYSGMLEANMALEVQKLFNKTVRDEIDQKVAEQVKSQLNLHQAMLNAQFNDTVEERVFVRMFEAGLVEAAGSVRDGSD